jgi:seryl-tRNA synthetase
MKNKNKLLKLGALAFGMVPMVTVGALYGTHSKPKTSPQEKEREANNKTIEKIKAEQNGNDDKLTEASEKVKQQNEKLTKLKDEQNKNDEKIKKLAAFLNIKREEIENLQIGAVRLAVIVGKQGETIGEIETEHTANNQELTLKKQAFFKVGKITKDSHTTAEANRI